MSESYDQFLFRLALAREAARGGHWLTAIADRSPQGRDAQQGPGHESGGAGTAIAQGKAA